MHENLTHVRVRDPTYLRDSKTGREREAYMHSELRVTLGLQRGGQSEEHKFTNYQIALPCR